MEKNKNALTDENKLLIYSIIDFLLKNTGGIAFFDSGGKISELSFSYVNSEFSLNCDVSEDSILLTAVDKRNGKSERRYWLTLKGSPSFKDEPEGIIEVAKNLGVIND